MLELRKQKLLVVAPHPDDEVVGCGGLIKKIKDGGGRVYVLFLTVGDTRDFSKRGLSTGKERQREIEKVAKFLKFDNYHLVYPGNDYHLRLDLWGQKALMDTIERESPVSIEKVKPTIVVFPQPASYNQDHRVAALATQASLRPAPRVDKHFVPYVLSYEEPADRWTMEARGEVNFFVELTKRELEVKISALKLYKSQLRRAPNLRSGEVIRSLAILRGAQFGTDFAEGYVLHRTTF